MDSIFNILVSKALDFIIDDSDNNYTKALC